MSGCATHKITVCTSCKRKGEANRRGYALIEKLRGALDEARGTIPEVFEVSGTACLAGCDRQCAVAFYGARKATYLFGDIETDQDIADLVSFARQYAFLHDGWCSSVDRPGKLRKSTLARVPACIVAADEIKEPIS